MITLAGAGRQARRLLLPLVSQSLLGMSASGVTVHAQQAPVAASDSGPLVAVAARRLPRGAVLAAGDIVLAHVVPQRSSSSAAQQPAPGWVTRRIVRAGEVLREPAVTPAPLVSAGQSVRFDLIQGGIHLSLDGVAASGASLGEHVTVRLGAKRRVTGIVAGPARVTAIDTSRTS